MYFAKQFKTVNAVHEVNEGCDLFNFIGLQMPDKMPTYVSRQGGLLDQQFLYIILTEIAVPQLIQLQDVGYRLKFRHSDQGNSFTQLITYPQVVFFIDQWRRF